MMLHAIYNHIRDADLAVRAVLFLGSFKTQLLYKKRINWLKCVKNLGSMRAKKNGFQGKSFVVFNLGFKTLLVFFRVFLTDNLTWKKEIQCKLLSKSSILLSQETI